MNYILEHEDLSNYLSASKYVDFDKKIIQDKIKELRHTRSKCGFSFINKQMDSNRRS